MKRSGLGVTGLLVILVLLVLFVVGCNSASNTPPVFSALAGGGDQSGGVIWSQQNVGLWVTGEGKASGAPDVANIVLGVQVQETSVAVAQREAAEAMDKIIKVLKSNGVADKDIQTQQFNIQMVTRWIDKENREETIGYRIMNTVVAKIRKVNEAGSVIDAVAVAGGNVTRINSINFTVDDPSPYYKEARDKAVVNAVAKAKQIASTAGVKLGKPISITENVAYAPSPIMRNYMKADAATASPSAPTPISAGELEFQITVQIVYAME